METNYKQFSTSLNKMQKTIQQKVGNEHMQLQLYQLVVK